MPPQPGPQTSPLLPLSFLPGLSGRIQSCGSSPRRKQLRKQQQVGTKVGSGLPWGKDPDPGLCPLITGLQLVKGSCLPWLPGGPGWAEEGGTGSGREGRPCPAPRGRASAEMRSSKHPRVCSSITQAFLGMLPGPQGLRSPRDVIKHDLRTGLSMTRL